MPLYEYRCPECDGRFEEIRGLGQADEDVECPACGSGSARRELSSFATTSGGRDGLASGSACRTRPGRGFT